jgi:hypothetical protein
VVQGSDKAFAKPTTLAEERNRIVKP